MRKHLQKARYSAGFLLSKGSIIGDPKNPFPELMFSNVPLPKNVGGASMKRTSIVAALIFASAAVSAEVSAESQKPIESVQTGRYTQVKNIPPIDQLNPLKVVIRTRIPQSISTVGESVEFLLVRSGYGLADSEILSEEAQALLRLPLPQVHRTIGPMTLDKALQTLSGEAFALVVDPVHRIVAFELSERLARVD